MKKCSVIIAVLLLASGMCAAKNSFALFTVPADERVEEKEGVDINEAYDEYIPPTHKIKSHEEAKEFLKNRNASCLPKPVPLPQLNRNRHIPKKSQIVASAVNKSRQSYDMIAFIFLAVWGGIIVLLTVYVLIVKMRSLPEKENE